MQMVETRDGTELYVKDWGQGRPVVLIHGWPLNADSWEYQAVRLAEAGHRVIAYDRRGFGRSDQPFDGYDYDTLADDLADVMAACAVQDATLVGFSMGGGEVARYMSRHAGAGVRQAVLISSVVPHLMQSDSNPDGVPEAAIDDILSGLRLDRQGFLKDFFRVFYGQGLILKPVSDAVLDWSWQMAMTASPQATLACAAAFARTDFTADLSAFTVPTLIIHGTADNTVPIDPTGRVAADMIPGATFLEYEGAPHGLTATHADQLFADLIAFLES